jgi:hypothetical protein
MCRYGMSIGGRRRAVLDQDLSPPIDEVREERQTITSGPTSSLQKNHLAPAASVAMDNHKRQRYAKKLISPDLKTGEKTKLPI